MKVNFPSSGIGDLYRGRQTAGTVKSAPAASTSKTDVADFSHGAGASLGKELLGAKASIQSSVNAPADSGRLASLQQRVKDGTYHIPTGDLVSAILDSYDL